MQSAIADMTVGGQPYDQAVGHCTKIVKADERLNNQNAVKRFQEWSASKKLDWLQPPIALIEGPRGILKVAVEPDIAYVEKGKIHVVLLWPYANKELKKKVAGIGVHMMAKSLSVGSFQGAEFCIHDVSKQFDPARRFKTGSIPTNPDKLLSFMLDQHELAYMHSHPKAA